ncbi:hypothetical protein [Lysinibacillus parviboronicapiens]|nr:hypothetical protein [Lysinibacillus parviboronicapiens]
MNSLTKAEEQQVRDHFSEIDKKMIITQRMKRLKKVSTFLYQAER